MAQIDDHTLKVQELFVRHQAQLKAFVLALCPDFARADDVVQEVFLTVTEKAHEFELGSRFLSWARSIARFKLLEACRKDGRRTLTPDTLDSLAAACPDDWANQQRLAALTECLGRLAPKAQEIVRLRYQREHSPPEIASLLSRTVNSVNVALSKARAALRACMDRRLHQEGVS